MTHWRTPREQLLLDVRLFFITGLMVGAVLGLAMAMVVS